MDKFPKEEIDKLLKRIKNGDQSAFNRLIDLKSKNLQKLAYTYLHDEMLSEDVVSDVFYDLISKCSEFKNEKNLNGWLNVVAINKSLNLLKKRSREILYEAPIHKGCNLEDSVEQIHIQNCLLKLNEDEGSAILYQQHGYTFKEISKMMNLSKNKVQGLLARAKKKFKDYYIN